MKSKKELIKKVKARYLTASKKEKGLILDELVANTELNRKYLIGRLAAKVDLNYVNPINRKRRVLYEGEVILKLIKIWEIFDYPCGQNLAPMLEEYIKVLEKFGEMNFTSETKEKLIKISSATIDRRLKKSKTNFRRKLFSTTKPGSMLKKQIPIKTSSWNESRLGFGELDTVAHCGNSLQGEFINSLTFTDIATGWTESVAIMGKAQSRVKEGLEMIKQRLPFDLLGIDPDNGSEFINWQLYHYCVANQIEFTRGRPYHKNDNAHIEQKNWTHVRKLVGYQRLDQDHQLELLNSLYANQWRLYKNFFIANKKLLEKRRVGGRIVKRFDLAKTPYQRAKDKGVSKLDLIYAKLNPVVLRKEIDDKLKLF